MILSDRRNGKIEQFEAILDDTLLELRKKALKDPDFFLSRSPTEIEEDVYNSMINSAINTTFAGKITLISNHTFPDIVANSCFGVEVKTTKSNSWKSTGNSVLETTRPSEMKHIYLFFAKLFYPVEFRCKPYSECLYNVAVTHSPRYLIDMELSPSETIFTKMQITYDELRLEENPVKHILRYLRSISKPGKEPWWLEIDSTTDNSVNATITPWGDLTPDEKDKILIELFVRFPELFSGSSRKYLGPGSYLIARHGIMSTNLRDLFTAGGKVDLEVGDKLFKNLPRIFSNFHSKQLDIQESVNDIDLEEAKYYWQNDNIRHKNELLPTWRSLLLKNAQTKQNCSEEVRYFTEIFNKFDEEHKN